MMMMMIKKLYRNAIFFCLRPATSCSKGGIYSVIMRDFAIKNIGFWTDTKSKNEANI